MSKIRLVIADVDGTLVTPDNICGTPDRSVFTYLYDFCGSTDSGQVFIDACPQGQIIRGISGRAGSWLDGIQIYCDTPAVPIYIP